MGVTSSVPRVSVLWADGSGAHLCLFGSSCECCEVAELQRGLCADLLAGMKATVPCGAPPTSKPRLDDRIRWRKLFVHSWSRGGRRWSSKVFNFFFFLVNQKGLAKDVVENRDTSQVDIL